MREIRMRELTLALTVAGALGALGASFAFFAGDDEPGGLPTGPGSGSGTASTDPGGTGPAANGSPSSDGAATGRVAELDPDAAERLRGGVFDGKGRALAGARLVPAFFGDDPLEGEGWTSDAQGRFDALAPKGKGRYVLRVSLAGRAGRMVSVHSGEDARIVLEAGGALEGTLRDAAGAPLAGTLHVLAGDWEGSVPVGADGRFRVPDLPAGIASVQGQAPGHVPRVGDTTIEVDRTARIDLVLTAGRTLRVRARLAGGGAAVGAKARLRGLEDGRLLEGEADGSGQLEVVGLAPGEASLIVTAEGHSHGPLRVLVPDGADPEPLDLTLEPDPRVTGAVRAASGEGVAEATIQIEPLSGGLGGGKAKTNSGGDGAFDLGTIPVGECVVRVEAAGYASAELPWLVAQDAPPLEVVLEQAAGVEGVVLNPDGTPAAKAEVQVDDGRPHLARADAEGRFAVTGLVAGPARVVARARGSAPARAEVELLGGDTAQVTLTLEPAATLRGVVRAAGGAALEDATVLVDDPDVQLEARTDAEGRFALEGLAPGPCRVFVSANGHVPVTLEADTFVELEATLNPERVVTGVVVDPAGNSVDVFAVAPAEAPFRVTWHRGGRFSEMLDPETRELIVRPAPSGHHHGEEDEPPALAPTRVPVPPGGGALRVTLPHGAEAEGVVVDARGERVPGAAFLVGHVMEEDLFGPGATDALGMSEDDGMFHVGGMPDGGLAVTISHPDHGPLQTLLVPGRGQTIQLPAEGRVSGVARGPDGLPAAGVPIILEGPCVRRGESGEGGVFTFRGLAAGDYTLTRVDTETSSHVSVRAGAEATVDLD